MNKILDLIDRYKTISIIGMEKNVGKTTTLNYILGEAKGRYTLGLTSIGRDGEEVDVVTSTEKPKIYVEKGSIIATAKEALFNCDITKEILDTTGIRTPMGEVIIVRALSDGYIDLAGPSLSKYIGNTCSRLISLGCDMVLVDGALSRKSFASPSITEATILSTGASLNKSMNKVVEQTIHTVNMLSIQSIENETIKKLYIEQLINSKVAIVDEGDDVRVLHMQTTMQSGKEIRDHVNEKTRYVLIKGVISDSLIEEFIRDKNKFKNITLVIEDGTKIFACSENIDRFNRIGAKIRVMKQINLTCITINPVSPHGYEFNKDKFISALKNKIDIPILNVFELINK